MATFDSTTDLPQSATSWECGSLTKMTYEGREFEVIVIDPDGLGKGQPSVGFGFRMAERNLGVPKSTLSDWVSGLDGDKCLKLPSGKALRVADIVGVDGNDYRVIEASDWFGMAIDLLINPGRTGKGMRTKLGDFVNWFAVKGFYAEAYVALKGVYSAKDSRATSKWLEARTSGIPTRKSYTDLLQSQGVNGFDYGTWTNRIYEGLFGLSANEMKKVWTLMEGNKKIARNYVPEALGLEAVQFCEDMVVRTYVDDLEEAHELAVNLGRRKFALGILSLTH